MGTRTKASPKVFAETKWGWERTAICGRAPAGLFFPEDRYDIKIANGLTAYQEEVSIIAEEWCSVCPVELVCRNHALEKREPAGVWGGLGVVEREEIWRKK